MKLIIRSYQNEEDYWRIREFLRLVMLSNNSRELSWHVTRWDYWIWFANPDIEKLTLEENVFIWETEAGQIAVVLEGIRRCGELGATVAYVGNDLPIYRAVGFKKVYVSECWLKYLE